MTAPELKPCPFCGAEAERIDIGNDECGNAGGSVIQCAKCMASSRVEFGFKENLIDAWNRRADLAAVQPMQGVWNKCTFDLSGAGYDCVLKDGDARHGAYGEGQKVFWDGTTINADGLYILSKLALDKRIAAAQPAPDPNAGAVKVKPLVWEPVGNPNGRYRLHSTIAWARNTCPYGPYFIGLSSSCKNGEYSWDGPANTGKRGFADPESAKAAAQADYAARILAAIEITPDPRDEVIARLVEENNWQIKARAQHWLRRTISAPEDAAVEEICEKYGYGAVMDAASRLWARKPYGSGAFYVGGCIGFKSDDEARAALAAAKAVMK